LPETTKQEVKSTEAKREHGSLLAAAEKRLLIQIAHRLPGWVNSDHLTLLGLFAMVAAGVLLAITPRWPDAVLWVNLCLFLNWFGDSLDGTVARVRNQQRPKYGFYVDHVVDAINCVFLHVGFAMSIYMSPEIALAMMTAYLLLCIDAALATYAVGVFRVSFSYFGPTELRLLLMAGVTWAWGHQYVPFAGKERLFMDVGGFFGSIGMGIAFLISVARNTITLYRREALPPR
jgi:archaetidylinositol phosphate synthase